MDDFMNRYSQYQLARLAIARGIKRTIRTESFCQRTVFSSSFDASRYSIKRRRRKLQSIVLSCYGVDPLYARHAIYRDNNKDIVVTSCIHFEDGECTSVRQTTTPKQIGAISTIGMVSR